MDCTECINEFRCDWDQDSCPWKHEGEHVEKQEAEWEEFIRRRFEWVNDYLIVVYNGKV